MNSNKPKINLHGPARDLVANMNVWTDENGVAYAYCPFIIRITHEWSAAEALWPSEVSGRTREKIMHPDPNYPKLAPGQITQDGKYVGDKDGIPQPYKPETKNN